MNKSLSLELEGVHANLCAGVASRFGQPNHLILYSVYLISSSLSLELEGSYANLRPRVAGRFGQPNPLILFSVYFISSSLSLKLEGAYMPTYVLVWLTAFFNPII